MTETSYLNSNISMTGNRGNKLLTQADFFSKQTISESDSAQKSQDTKPERLESWLEVKLPE